MKKRVLFVEDSPTQGEKLCYELERLGFEIRLEPNGREALKAFPVFAPDLVVTDILMPEMDGYTLCRTLKAGSRGKVTPVILVTRLSDSVEVVRALESGADGFVVKPYISRNLGSRLRTILSEVSETAEEPRTKEFEINFQGETFRIPLSRRQILNVLLSTYDMAVEKNSEIRAAEEKLRELNEHLEEKVRERTHELVQEVSERKKAEQRLKETNEALEKRAGQLQRLALALTRTEQAERERLAGVLHDHLQQLLVGAKMLVGAKRSSRERSSPDEGLERVEDLLAEAVTISRDLTVELCPPILREGGLTAALEWLGRRVKDKYGLDVALDLDSDVEECEEEVTVFLFQAARELLFNVVKHAGVGQAKMLLSRESGGRVRLTVKDDGKGFEIEEDASDRKGKDSFGLFSLEERAEAIRGRLEIRSKPMEGTEISLVVPCNPVAKSVPDQETIHVG